MAYPSTFLTLQNNVIAKLRLDATNDLAKTKDWINRVYYRACIECGITQTTTTLALVAGTANSTLAAAISRIQEMYVTPVGSTQSAPLVQTNLDEILNKRQSGGGSSVATGSVTHYALLGTNRLEWYPTPASADTVTIYYVAFPTALSADADLPVIPEPYATDVLEFGALAEGADYKNDPSEMTYRSLYEDALKKLRGHMARRGGVQTQQLVVAGSYAFLPHDPSTDVR